MDTSVQAAQRAFELPANAAAAGMARRELASTPGIIGDVAYKALLMTSELIAVFIEDLVPEPGHTLLLSVDVTAQRVRIEVAGRAPGVSPGERLHSHEPPSLGGMGLQIVERMADAWGIEGARNTMMWFELARDTH